MLRFALVAESHVGRGVPDDGEPRDAPRPLHEGNAALVGP
jgi:hypothetical protein